MKRIVLGLLALLPIAVTAEPIDLETATEMALEADPRVEERRQLVNAARALVREVKGESGLRFDVNSFLGLTLGVDGGFYEGGAETCSGNGCRPRDDLYDGGHGLSPWLNMQFSVIKPLETFGKIEHYSKAARHNVKVKDADVRLAREKTRIDVARAYFGVLAARDTRRLLEDVQDRVEKARGIVEEGIQTGKSRLSDRYALETGAAMVKRYLAQARSVETIALGGLKTLLGRDLDAELELADRHIRPLPMPETPLDDYIDQALEQRPEMQQVKAGLAARRSLVEAHRAERLPNVYAGVAGSLSYAPERDRLDNPYIHDPFNHVGATPMVGLQWKWKSGVQPARVERAQAELDALVAKASLARQGIPYQVAEAHARLASLREEVEQLDGGSRSARRWMVSSYADFEAGFEEMSKLVDAFTAYVQTRSEYISAVNDYNVQRFKLDKISGGMQ